MLTGSLVKTITSDGIELQGFWMNQKSNVAVFHSHGTAGDFYTHKFIEIEGERLAANNISFLTANNRGHDVYADLRKHINGHIEWTQIGGAFERFTDCTYDIGAWINFLEEQGIKKVILQGHSLSQKLIYYLDQTNDPRIIAQIHISPCNDAGYMYFLLGKQKYKEVNQKIHSIVKEGKGRVMLPKKLWVVAPMSAAAYADYLTEEGIGNIFPYHNDVSVKWKMLSNMRVPLLAVYGGADSFIKPSIKEATALFKEKAKNSVDVTTQIINNAPHSYVEYEEQLVDIIEDWVKKRFL